MYAVDVDAAFEDFAREERRDGRAEAHGFVDAGAQEAQFGEGGAGDDVLYSGETGADEGG